MVKRPLTLPSPKGEGVESKEINSFPLLAGTGRGVDDSRKDHDGHVRGEVVDSEIRLYLVIVISI